MCEFLLLNGACAEVETNVRARLATGTCTAPSCGDAANFQPTDVCRVVCVADGRDGAHERDGGGSHRGRDRTAGASVLAVWALTSSVVGPGCDGRATRLCFPANMAGNQAHYEDRAHGGRHPGLHGGTG